MHKIAYKSACMTDRPEMFAPTRGFSGMADSMEPCKMLWSRTLLPWQRNLAWGRRSNRLPACYAVCLLFETLQNNTIVALLYKIIQSNQLLF